MSWTRSISGTRDEVNKQLEEATDIATPAKVAIQGALDSFASANRFSISTQGTHTDKSISFNVGISVLAEGQANSEQRSVGDRDRDAREAEQRERAAWERKPGQP